MPATLHKKLKVELDVLVKDITNLYAEGLTQREIATQYGCNVACIEKFFKRNGIATRNYSAVYKNYKNVSDFSDKEMEILDGIMLADGHIDQQMYGARLTYGCKFRETLFDIEKSLPSLKFSNHWQSKITNCWHFKSRGNPYLLREHSRWYPEKKKIVPKDVRITPLSCYWWMIGDGYVKDYQIHLCTDAFTRDDNEFLVQKMKEINFCKTYLNSKNRVIISGRDSKIFSDWIKESVNISSQYLYKWNHNKRFSK
jgi:hypothetical protein